MAVERGNIYYFLAVGAYPVFRPAYFYHLFADSPGTSPFKRTRIGAVLSFHGLYGKNVVVGILFERYRSRVCACVLFDVFVI